MKHSHRGTPDPPTKRTMQIVPCVLNTLRIQQLSDVILFYDLAFFATALICRLQKGTPALCVEPVNSAMTQHAPCIHSGV